MDSESLDPNFRPDHTDNLTFTIQREMNSHMQLEVGYIGKNINNEYQSSTWTTVPIYTTLGGQSFARAYAQIYQQTIFNGVAPASVTAQPFFETAWAAGIPLSAKATPTAPRRWLPTTASLIKETAVSDLWNKMAGNSSSWILPRTTYGQALQRRLGSGHLDQLHHQHRLG